MQRFWIAAGLLAVIFLHSASLAAEQIAATPPAPPTMGYGMMLARMIFMLAAVCALAVVTLRWGLKRLTSAQSEGQSIEVISRAIIEPRRAILVARVGTRYMILGTGEHGMTPLGELSEEEAEAMQEKARNFQVAQQQKRPSFQKIFTATARSEQKTPQTTENAQPL